MAGKFRIYTFGCKVNQCDSESLAAGLRATGWRQVAGKRRADVFIVNTCTVTGKAAAQCRQMIRRLARNHPKSRILVTGCYAQIGEQELKHIDGVDAVVNQDGHGQIPGLFARWFGPQNPPAAPGPPRAFSDARHLPLSPEATASRTRPFLKVQDGCNAFCSYCIVPHTRGRSRSVPIEAVLQRFEVLKAAGYHEAVLTGIHLGHYGKDLTPPTDLNHLLATLEPRCDDIRIRLSSIEPRELSPEIVARVAVSDHFCHHFHIPLQSGDDRILKRMNRPYRRAQFRRLVEGIAAKIADVAIGVDILVGFPGETETAFDATLKLIKDLPVAYLHIFPFSARQGTPAAGFDNPVAAPVIKDRCRRLRAIGRQKQRSFYLRYTGRALDVVVESTRDSESGLLKGVSSNYIPVLLEGSDTIKNRPMRVTVKRVDDRNRVFGALG